MMGRKEERSRDFESLKVCSKEEGIKDTDNQEGRFKK